MAIRFTLLLIALVSGSASGEEPSAETKAIIKSATTYLKEKKADDRVKGADMLGELGENGRLGRRDLCVAIMDANPKVQRAAADALKKVHKEMAEVALSLFIDANHNTLEGLVKAGANAEPLTPIVLAYAKQLAGVQNKSHTTYHRLADCIDVLAAIAPDDELANKYIISGLSSTNHRVVDSAVVSCGTISKGKSALPTLKALAIKSTIATRTLVVDSLVKIADKNNRKDIEKTLSSIRFDSDPAVRKAVDVALAELSRNADKD